MKQASLNKANLQSVEIKGGGFIEIVKLVEMLKATGQSCIHRWYNLPGGWPLMNYSILIPSSVLPIMQSKHMAINS